MKILYWIEHGPNRGKIIQYNANHWRNLRRKPLTVKK